MNKKTQYGPLIISLSGKNLYPVEKQILEHELVGGVFLFSENFENKEQLSKLTNEINGVSKKCNKKIIIMTDHEGGFLQPFTNGFSSIPAARRIGDIYDIDPNCALNFSKNMGEITAFQLKSCGVDVVLGPVVDLDKGNAVITGLDRAFHSNPVIVTDLAEAYIEGLKNKKMKATLKHFPGHGANVGDSHIAQPIDNRSFDELIEMDLFPFKKLVSNNNVGAIMSAHIQYPKVDQEVVTYSRVWLEDFLRKELRFDGVIISDSLTMMGAGNENIVKRIKCALELSDVVLLCDKKPEEYVSLLELLNSENIKLSSESIGRIEKWLGTDDDFER